MPTRASAAAFVLIAAIGAAGCMLAGRHDAPISTEFVPALQPAETRTLVVVLPGMFNDDENLAKHGVHDAIHRAWPHADILLTSARLPYYRGGTLTRRVHEEIVLRYRRAGYRHVWLAGGSMGGLGVLMYEHDYPGQATGLLLFAPRMGTGDLIDEIRDAGGLARWEPGPLPPRTDGEHYDRQVWAMVKGWRGRVPNVWLICGNEDRMLQGVRLLAGELPRARYIEREGSHDWDFWLTALEQLFAHVSNSAGAAEQPQRAAKTSSAE